jgi:hypothetical protein
MLGQPEPAVSPALGMPREIQRIPEGLRWIAPERDGGQIENGIRDHLSA